LAKLERSADKGPSDTSSDNSEIGKLLIFSTTVVVVLLILWYFLPVGDWITAFQTWIKSLGALGYVIVAAVYIVATLLMVPSSVMTLAAGVTFGFWAFPLVVVSATSGACFAFLIARYLARQRVEAFVAKRKTFAAIDMAIEEYGWKGVGLMRLSPLVPFNLQNYLFGVTKVDFVGYALSTLIAIMPGTLLFVWFGTIGASASDSAGADIGTAQWIMLGLGLLATVVVITVVSIKARQKLKEVGAK
jgi:uncharacterized membrane protein YdjX (TVP38/TMEM64 family)